MQIGPPVILDPRIPAFETEMDLGSVTQGVSGSQSNDRKYRFDDQIKKYETSDSNNVESSQEDKIKEKIPIQGEEKDEAEETEIIPDNLFLPQGLKPIALFPLFQEAMEANPLRPLFSNASVLEVAAQGEKNIQAALKEVTSQLSENFQQLHEDKPIFSLEFTHQGFERKTFKELVDTLWVQNHLSLSSFEDPLFLMKTDSFDFQVKELATQVRTQVIDHMQPLMTRVHTTQEGGEMTLQLRPPQLGAVKIAVQVDHQVVRVGLQAERETTRILLNNQISDLRQHMSAIGFKVDEIHVSRLESEIHAGASHERNPQKEFEQPQQQSPQEESSQSRTEQSRTKQSWEDTFQKVKKEIL